MTTSRKPYPSDVSDEEWALAAPYLTLLPEDAGQRTHRLREVFDGLRYLVRYGVPWRALPNDLPPWHAVYDQAQRWLKAGCFERLAHDLRAVLRLAVGRGEEPSAAVLDSRTAESGVKRNIPGPCGKALAVSGDPGWGDGGRDASGAGGTGAAGRAQGRGAEPAGDRAGARPGGLDDQSGAAPQRPAERRLPAGARRGLLPGAPPAPGRPRARRAARPLRARAPAGRLDPRADRRLAEARRGARAPSGVARDDLRLHPPARAEGREALEAAAARARQAGPPPGSSAAQHHHRAALDPRPARGRPGAQGGRALGGRPADLPPDPAGAGARGAQDPLRARGPAGRRGGRRDRGGADGGVPAAGPVPAVLDHLRQRYGVRPAWPARQRLRDDHLVLRRLRLLAEGSRGERERAAAPRPAARPRPRRPDRRRAAGDRAQPQPDASQVPRLPDAPPGAAQGAWQGRPNPLRLTRCASPVNPPSASREPRPSLPAASRRRNRHRTHQPETVLYRIRLINAPASWAGCRPATKRSGSRP